MDITEVQNSSLSLDWFARRVTAGLKLPGEGETGAPDWALAVATAVKELGAKEGYTILSAASVPWVPDVVWQAQGDLALALACEQPGHDELTVRLDSLLFFKAPLKVLAFCAVTLEAAEKAMVFLSDHMQGFRQHLRGEDYLFLVHLRGRAQPCFFRSVTTETAKSQVECQFVRLDSQQFGSDQVR